MHNGSCDVWSWRRYCSAGGGREREEARREYHHPRLNCCSLPISRGGLRPLKHGSDVPTPSFCLRRRDIPVTVPAVAPTRSYLSRATRSSPLSLVVLFLSFQLLVPFFCPKTSQSSLTYLQFLRTARLTFYGGTCHHPHP